MRLEPIIIKGKTSVRDLLKYFMGKNTEDRQNFIIDNLRIEEDEFEEDEIEENDPEEDDMEEDD